MWSIGLLFFLGWNDLDLRQRAQMGTLVDNTPENDLPLAYDQFIKKLGKNTHLLTGLEMRTKLLRSHQYTFTYWV